MTLDNVQRNFYTTSSCGICGKSSLEALLALPFPALPPVSWKIDAASVMLLPDKLRKAQAIFEHTGGLHAAGLFTSGGRTGLVREDVGRHNAVDKVTGGRFLAGRWPLSDCILVVSGRASFELVQKAVASRIPMLVAVGAPSSLAVETAERFGVTLIGFTTAAGFNIYTGQGADQPRSSGRLTLRKSDRFSSVTGQAPRKPLRHAFPGKTLQAIGRALARCRRIDHAIARG